jgi:hypothetical protein
MLWRLSRVQPIWSGYHFPSFHRNQLKFTSPSCPLTCSRPTAKPLLLKRLLLQYLVEGDTDNLVLDGSKFCVSPEPKSARRKDGSAKMARLISDYLAGKKSRRTKIFRGPHHNHLTSINAEIDRRGDGSVPIAPRILGNQRAKIRWGLLTP